MGMIRAVAYDPSVAYDATPPHLNGEEKKETE